MVVLILVLQAGWLALTARYPQAFDENFHFGLIKLHATQWLPFFTHQPPDAAIHGAVVRDPSYLYHYLLSFPYRLLTHMTASETVQIIVLRFINIGLFVGGLFAYRSLFNELGISRALRNTVLLCFVLTPVVPLLAGQINYDNLMIGLTGLLFLYTARYIRALQDVPKSKIPFLLALQIVLYGAVGSIVTFPFAPIFFAAVCILAFLTLRKLLVLHQSSDPAARQLRPGSIYQLPGRLKLAVFVVLTLVAVGLSSERYGVNLAQYHSPVPKCDKVLSSDECQAYSPYARDYQFAATYPHPTAKGIAVYPGVWAHRMVYESMFTITSYIYEPWNTVSYTPFPPLTIANYVAWTVIIAGFATAVLFWRSIWGNLQLRILLLITAFYTLILFLQNYAMYLHTGEAVAIHGRYLVAVYPVLFLCLAIGLNRGFEKLHIAQFKGVILLAVVLLFLQGGGITTWIIRSDPSWYWQQSHAAGEANWLAKDVLDKVIHH